jgi:hypothetical protein
MNDEMEEFKQLKNQLFGWILFVICAVLFILAGVRVGDWLTIAASLVFLLACVVFLVPLVQALRQVNKSD